jgi:hypothetical protein
MSGSLSPTGELAARDKSLSQTPRLRTALPGLTVIFLPGPGLTPGATFLTRLPALPVVLPALLMT